MARAAATATITRPPTTIGKLMLICASTTASGIPTKRAMFQAWASSEQRRAGGALAQFIVQPGLLGTAAEHRAQPEQHRPGEHAAERRHQALDREPDAGQGNADDDREPAAVDVGDHPGRHLAEHADGLQHGAGQHQLECGQADRGDLVDQIDGDDQGETETLDRAPAQIHASRVEAGDHARLQSSKGAGARAGAMSRDGLAWPGKVTTSGTF